MSPQADPHADSAFAELRRLAAAGTEEWPAPVPGMAERLLGVLEYDLEAVAPLVSAQWFPDHKVAVDGRRLDQMFRCDRKMLADRGEPFRWSTYDLCRETVLRGAESLAARSRLGSRHDDDIDPYTVAAEALKDLRAADPLADEYARLLASVAPPPKDTNWFGVDDVALEAGRRLDFFAEMLDELADIPSRLLLRQTRSAELLDGRFSYQADIEAVLSLDDSQATGDILVCADPWSADDPAYCALVSTLAGRPPRAVAYCRLDEQLVHIEAVTEKLLTVAARRATAGVVTHLMLMVGDRALQVLPGHLCYQCRARKDCEPGTAHVGDFDPRL